MITNKQKELLKQIKLNGTITINQAKLIYTNPKHIRDVVQHLALKKLIEVNYGHISLTEKGIKFLKEMDK